MLVEKIVEAIKNLEPLDIPEILPVYHNSKIGCLCYGDEHYGAEFELRGLFNEIMNSYSPEIFEQRMWDLLNQVVDIVDKEQLTDLNVWSFGDFCDGVLRVSQLMKLRYGVVEGTVYYSNFIVNWLNELSKYVRVRYQMARGNHTELRMLGEKKGTFEDENMSFVVENDIKNRLSNNPNFEFIQNPTGYIFDNVFGQYALGIHGEVKNMSNAIKDFSSTYGIQIDYLIGGHLHHKNTEEVGMNREVINVPSIIGIDKYSIKLNKTSNAGALLMIFEEGKGKTIEYKIRLK